MRNKKKAGKVPAFLNSSVRDRYSRLSINRYSSVSSEVSAAAM
jgi:hypothetical protein